MIFLILLYFIPSFVAWYRNHRQFNAIFLLNFLLGWTFIGWVAALIWSVIHSNDNQEINQKRGNITKCPNCAEYVKTEAIICKHCGSSLNDDSGFDIEKYRK